MTTIYGGDWIPIAEFGKHAENHYRKPECAPIERYPKTNAAHPPILLRVPGPARPDRDEKNHWAIGRYLKTNDTFIEQTTREKLQPDIFAPMPGETIEIIDP